MKNSHHVVESVPQAVFACLFSPDHTAEAVADQALKWSSPLIAAATSYYRDLDQGGDMHQVDPAAVAGVTALAERLVKLASGAVELAKVPSALNKLKWFNANGTPRPANLAVARCLKTGASPKILGMLALSTLFDEPDEVSERALSWSSDLSAVAAACLDGIAAGDLVDEKDALSNEAVADIAKLAGLLATLGNLAANMPSRAAADAGEGV